MTSEFPSSRSEDDPDVALMCAVARGSDDALAALIRRHQSPLLNYFNRSGALEDGEDMVQETFLRVYRYRDRYRPTARFQTFLYTLARHVWLDRCRKKMRKERLMGWLVREAEVQRDTSTEALDERAAEVQDALGTLSPKLKEVLILKVYQGLRYQEIAQVLNIPVGTVKSRINLAMEAMMRAVHEP